MIRWNRPGYFVPPELVEQMRFKYKQSVATEIEVVIMIDDRSIKRIKNVLCVAEQATQTIPYDKVEVMADGPDDVRQITLSIGFTQYGGNLGKVLQAYQEKGGLLGDVLGAYVGRMKSSKLVNDSEFKSLLKKAGREDIIMGEVQEEQFEKLYMGPAVAWGEKEGFELPFSYLIICDSFLHSGSILGFLRERFAECTPAHGGREKVWTTDYLNTRHDWLKNHSNSLVRTSSYRTVYYKELLAMDDWQLDAYHTVAMNGIKPMFFA
jgi:chitosanase